VKFNFTDGWVTLTTDNNPNSLGQPLVKSGELTTWRCWNQLYGYFEVRMKIPAGGVKYWPAFLLYNAASGWLPEVDIAEFDQNNNTGFSSTIHPTDNTKSPHAFYNFHTDLSAQFHTYALDWTSTYIKIYLDNILIFTETSWVPQVPLYVLIGNGISQGSSSVDVPGIMYIDYLRIYK
jgi:beta-glucanase (GH16 family)